MAYSAYGLMAILWPIISFYYINPTNVKSHNLMFPESISNKYPDLVMNQIVLVGCFYFIGLLLFENPPDFSSDLSNYFKLSKEQIRDKARINSFNGSIVNCKRGLFGNNI